MPKLIETLGLGILAFAAIAELVAKPQNPNTDEKKKLIIDTQDKFKDHFHQLYTDYDNGKVEIIFEGEFLKNINDKFILYKHLNYHYEGARRGPLNVIVYFTPLCLLALNGYTKLTKTLLELGADPYIECEMTLTCNEKFKISTYPMHYAALKKHTKTLETFAKHDQNLINSPDSHNMTPYDLINSKKNEAQILYKSMLANHIIPDHYRELTYLISPYDWGYGYFSDFENCFKQFAGIGCKNYKSIIAVKKAGVIRAKILENDFSEITGGDITNLKNNQKIRDVVFQGMQPHQIDLIFNELNKIYLQKFPIAKSLTFNLEVKDDSNDEISYEALDVPIDILGHIMSMVGNDLNLDAYKETASDYNINAYNIGLAILFDV